MFNYPKLLQLLIKTILPKKLTSILFIQDILLDMAVEWVTVAMEVMEQVALVEGMVLMAHMVELVLEELQKTGTVHIYSQNFKNEVICINQH